jgi:uncharacterized protein (UPF0254 family)
MGRTASAGRGGICVVESALLEQLVDRDVQETSNALDVCQVLPREFHGGIIMCCDCEEVGKHAGRCNALGE